jgi:hypothetical protein
MQLEAAGVTDAASQQAASHLGKAVGMTSLLRGTVHHAQRWVFKVSDASAA